MKKGKSEHIIRKYGKNSKVVEEINTITNESIIFLNDQKYYPDENLPMKLMEKMTRFGDKIKASLRFFLTEIQGENKNDAMSFIKEINKYLKVFRTWKDCSDAANFVALESEAWRAYGNLVTWMNKSFECDGFDENEGIFSFE